MTAKNDITGDSIQTRPGTEAFRDNFDRIFKGQVKAAEEDKDATIARLRGEVKRLQEVIADMRDLI